MVYALSSFGVGNSDTEATFPEWIAAPLNTSPPGRVGRGSGGEADAAPRYP